MSGDNIARLLVSALIREEVLAGVPEDYREVAGDRGEGLVKAGLVAESTRLRVIARLLHLDFVELGEDFTVDETLIRAVSPERVKEWEVVPLAETERELRVACGYPYDPALEDRLHRLTGKAVRLALCERQQLQTALVRAQLGRHILERSSAQLRTESQASCGEDQHTHDLEAPAQDPVVALVNQLCCEAIRRAASDVHLETTASGLAVRYRVDGTLVPAGVDVGAAHAVQMVSRLKVMAGLDIAEHQLPQDGRFRLLQGGFATDVRASVMPTVFGEDVVLRFLDRNIIVKGDGPSGLDALGLEPAVLSSLRRALREPAGMILVAGPTGSGKTTTLYGVLVETSSGLEKIVTIEDPVEYQLPGVVQIPVNEAKGLTFARGLRAILRHDPDRILVGEIRDLETANIAVQAAMTGHLVFSTVHANEPLDVIARMSHMGVDRYNFLSSLRCVLAQRLLRRLCPNCATRHALSGEERELFVEEGIEPPAEMLRAGRCRECDNMGYRGRMAIAETLTVTPTLRRLLLERAPQDVLQHEIERQAHVPLRRAALLKVAARATSLFEADRVTSRRQA